MHRYFETDITPDNGRLNWHQNNERTNIVVKLKFEPTVANVFLSDLSLTGALWGRASEQKIRRKNDQI